MKLGPGHPVWTKLYDELVGLAAETGGEFAFAIDEGNGLWCVGLAPSDEAKATRDIDRATARFFDNEVHPRVRAMQRGARFDISKSEGDDRYAAVSFASLYVVAVWFDGPFESPRVLASIRRALPRIETLVVDLLHEGGPPTRR